MTPYYKFTVLNSGSKKTHSGSAEAWSDLAEMFWDFLMGCGFLLTKQQLSDYFCDTYTSTPSVNHAEAYGLQPADPQTQFANPNDSMNSTKLYEFTVSDTHGRALPEIWEVARHSANEQCDFERCNDIFWPAWRVVMSGFRLDPDLTKVYTFEVLRV